MAGDARSVCLALLQGGAARWFCEVQVGGGEAAGLDANGLISGRGERGRDRR